MRHSQRAVFVLGSAAVLLFLTGCGKKVPLSSTPPPPFQPESGTGGAAVARPEIKLFSAEPSTIQRGERALLRWNAEGAAAASLEPGAGTVATQGSLWVSPSDSTTYRLHVSGPGGVADASATVAVTAPPPPPPPPAEPATKLKTLGERVIAEVRDVYFDYDQYDIRADDEPILARDADALKDIFRDFPNAVVVIEGHCDERGSAEYNLGLGDRRATSVRTYLIRLGIPAARLTTVSYGKERPQCTESTEACWQRNRRAHFSTETAASSKAF